MDNTDDIGIDSEMQVDVLEISPQELKAELENAVELSLFDVRDRYEAEIVKIEGSSLMTRELADDILQNWPQDKRIILYCHAGVRSLTAVQYFRENGMKNVLSLAGGIDRWAREIDPELPRY